MSTAVQVCSNALLSLGQRPINSFQDLSDSVLAAANLYPMVRDAVLRAHPWNCATRRVVLSPETARPAFGWNYRFLLPGDCLRVLSVGRDQEHEFPYAIESGELLADESAIYLRYIWRNEQPATWDAVLVRAMTAAMAEVLAIPATGDMQKKQSANGDYLLALQQARAIDGQEVPSETAGDFPLLASRF